MPSVTFVILAITTRCTYNVGVYIGTIVYN